MRGESKNTRDTHILTSLPPSGNSKWEEAFASVRVEEDAFDKLLVYVYFHEHLP